MEKKQTNGKSAGDGTATVDDVIISGESYSTIDDTPVKINLGGDVVFNDEISAGDDVKDWFTDNNLPSGLSAVVTEVEPGAATIEITVSGKPDVGSARDLSITIPEGVLEGWDSAIPVTENDEALYDITAVIIDENDLQNFAAAVNGGDVKQNAKLQSSTTVIDATTGVPALPIARDYAHAYEGDFDGSGGKIKICLSDDEGFLALFGINKGTIHDLTVCGSVTLNEDAGNEDYIAGVVAYNDYDGTIEKVINKVNVTAESAGEPQPEIAHNIGGIAGFNGWDQYNDDSPHTGIAPTDEELAGGTVSKCRNEGSITGGFNKIGGIVGENAGTIEECANIGEITCVKRKDDRGWPGVGGITGRNGNNNDPTEYGHIINCYNWGIINDNADTGAAKNAYGGITGWCDTISNVKNCYTTGEINQKGVHASTSEVNPIIGTVDSDPQNTDNNYSLKDIFASSENPKLIGIRKEGPEMTGQTFIDELNGSGGPYVAGTTVEGYPQFSWEVETSKK